MPLVKLTIVAFIKQFQGFRAILYGVKKVHFRQKTPFPCPENTKIEHERVRKPKIRKWSGSESDQKEGLAICRPLAFLAALRFPFALVIIKSFYRNI
jgi:hypothetical protein